MQVPWRFPEGSAGRSYTGALLADVLRASGQTPAPPSIGFGNYYVLVEANDGFRITIAYFEVTPRATDKIILLAYEQDGEALPRGLRLIVPDEGLAGRSITGVTRVQLRSVPSVEPQPGRPSSRTVTVGGLVARPEVFDAGALASLPQHEVTTRPAARHGGIIVEPRRYSGPLLWDVLQAAGPRLDAQVREDILNKVVIVRGVDGYSAAIAAGEIEPRFMGQKVIVATAVEGRPLPDSEGGIRLIVPADKAVGRALRGVQSIDLLDA